MQLFMIQVRLAITDSNIMKNILTLLLSLVSIVGFSQKETLAHFTAIEIFGPFEIELIKSDKEAIEMRTINVDKDDLTVEVNRGELLLKLRTRHFLTDWDSDKFRNEPRIKTKVYYKDLDEIKIAAGASLKSEEILKSKKFVLEGSMGADLELKIQAETIYVRSSMGATLNLQGETDFLEVKANMGAVLNASRLISKVVFVKASMGSDANVYASDEVDIEANMGAIVRYSGEPMVRHTNTKIGADIRRRDH